MVSGRYNALYGPEEILNLVMLMCSGNMYSENAVNGLKGAQLEQGAGRRVPTPQWLNARLRMCPVDKMRQICRSVTDATVRAGLNAGLLTGRLVFGRDKHNQPCHDDPPDESETVRTPRERGISHARSFFTVQTVGTEDPLTIGCHPVVSGEPLHHFVREGIADMRRNDLNPGLALVDREFNNVMVIRAFGEMDVEFLMPMIKRSKIKKMIRKFRRRKGGNLGRYTMHSPKYGSVTVCIVICRKANSEDYDKIEDKYVVLCTNMPVDRISACMDALPVMYRQRWQIETGYRLIEQGYAKTHSRNFATRLFVFSMSLVYNNLWVLVNCMREGRRVNGKATVKGISVKSFQFMVTRIIFKMFCDLSCNGVYRSPCLIAKPPDES